MRDFSKLKICFVAGTLEHGGAERQLFYMLQALCQRGTTLRVLCLDRGEFWETPIRSLGVSVTWVGQSQSRLARLIRILKELRNDPPDLCQSQHFFANAYAGLPARLLGFGAIGAMRSETVPELLKNGLVGGWLNLRLPRLIAANSRAAIQQAIARGIPASRLHFLPNVVDMGLFKPPEIHAERPLTLLSVGRIVTDKRLDRFIAALGRLRTDFDVQARGWIVGPAQDPGLLKELEAQAARLGLLPERLQFLGGVSTMAPLYQQADICVLTSDFEGTPNVLLEAMASGLPVVATRVGGVPEIVQHGKTGLLLDRDDEEGLVAALLELAKDPRRRMEMGRHAREYVEKNHALERLPGFLQNLYDLALPPLPPGKPDVVEETPVSFECSASSRGPHD